MKVVAQSDGLDPRPPYVREVRLVRGEGSDIQAFGYDESSVPETEREALRAETRSQDVGSLPPGIVRERRQRAFRHRRVEADAEPDRGGSGGHAVTCRVIVHLPVKLGRDRPQIMRVRVQKQPARSRYHSPFNQPVRF